MKFTSLLTLLVCLSGSCFAQDLTCQDFKKGRFYIPKSEVISEYHFTGNDSLLMITDSIGLVADYILERKGKEQKEWQVGDPNSDYDRTQIEWVSDCSYRLTYLLSKDDKDGWKFWVNAQGGILVEMVNISGQCMTYQATLTNKDGDKMVQDGIICKETD